MKIARWFHAFILVVLVTSAFLPAHPIQARTPDNSINITDPRIQMSPWERAGVEDPEVTIDRFLAGQQPIFTSEQRSEDKSRTASRPSTIQKSDNTYSFSAMFNTIQQASRFALIEHGSYSKPTASQGQSTLYLPLVLFNPVLNNVVQIQPNQAAVLRSTDGVVQISIPAGAVAQPTTLRYAPSAKPTINSYQAIGAFFNLSVSTNSVNKLASATANFLKPITIQVNYPETWRSTSLVFGNYTQSSVSSLQASFNHAQRTAIAQVQTLGNFGVFAATVDACTTPIGGNGMPLNITTVFSATYETLKLPCPSASATNESGIWMQGFPSGSVYPAGFLVYNDAKSAAFYLSTNGKIQFLTHKQWLGLPVSHYDKAGPVPPFRDEVNNFEGKPIMYFEKGFISDSGNSAEAHRWFPAVKTGTVTMTPHRKGVTNDYEYDIKFDFGFDLYGGITALTQLEAQSGGEDVSPEAGRGITSWSTTLAQRIPRNQSVEFFLRISRSMAPSTYPDDLLMGYMPCTHVSGAPLTFSVTPVVTETVTSKTFNYTCSSVVGDDGTINLPPPDTTPPVFHYVDIRPYGRVIHVQTNVTDNRAVATVELDFNGAGYQVMTSLGNGLYSIKVNGKSSGSNTYLLKATDTSGNFSTFPADGKPYPLGVDNSWNYGLQCIDKCRGYQGSAADPVNTQNGNFTDIVKDAFVKGIGDANIEISRAYNSLAAVSGSGGGVRLTADASGKVQQQEIDAPSTPFGRGWTFPYAIRLMVVDDAVASFAKVFYPDGRTATFEKSGAGFKSTTPQNHDTLTKTGAGYELRHKRTLEVDVFDQSGKLIAHKDRNGNTVTFEYSGDKLTTITNASGRKALISYNGDGFISQIDLPEGRSLKYTYENGDLATFTDGNNGVTQYEYNAKHQLTAIITPKGHASLRMKYDDQGRVSEQIVGATETYNLAYSDDGSLTTTTDANGYQTKHYYDDEGRLIKNEDARGYFEEYKYDADFNRTYFKDRGGREYIYTFDDRGNKLTENGPLGWKQQWEYNELDRVTKHTDAETRVTSMVYDERGNLTKLINADQKFTETSYDSRGLPLTISDFNTNVTVNTFDPTTADLLTSTNAEGDQTTFTYDGLGRMVSMKNGNDNKYRYVYDKNDNLLTVDGELSYHLAYRYDANNNRTHVIDPNGGDIETFYDASELVVKVENQLDFPTTFEYDKMKHLTKKTDANSNVWTYEYDEVYNQIAEHAPEDTHTFVQYDAMRLPILITRCLSTAVANDCAQKQVEKRTYDDLDRLMAMIANYNPSVAPDADSNVMTQFEYDKVGNITKMLDGNNNPTWYQYDKLNRVIRIEDAEAQVTLTEYDGMGNITKLTNPRKFSTLYEYDKANRLKALTNADNKTWRYRYDHNSNMVNMTDPHNIITHYEFDKLDRTSAVIQNYVDGGAATVEQNVRTGFRYDLAGNLRFVDDPRGIYTTEHQYDAAHRRKLTIDNEHGRTEFSYDKVDNLVKVLDGNQHPTTTTYDGLNRVKSIANAEQHTVWFAYDRLSNLVQLTDARGYLTKYQYDGMNRPIVTTDAMNGTWQSFYDPMGNLLKGIDANGHEDRFSYDLVYRLKSATDAEGFVTSSTYDKNGNRITITDGNNHTSTMTYDVLDRLATFTNAENETTSYQYNALGNQTRMIEADNIVTAYGFDPLYRLNSVTLNYRIPAISNHETNVTTNYNYDHVGNMTQIIDANDNSTTFSFDGMNRLVREVDAEKNQWDYGYDPVGNRTWRLDANRDLTKYSYYDDNQLKLIDYDDSTSVAFEYDQNNNRTAMRDHLGKSSWSFDPLNRITDVTDALGRHLGYGYDPVSNRTSLTYADDLTVNYRYFKNNWLKEVYDPQGNLTSYKRDGVGLMTHTTNPNGTVADAAYDKANRMLSIENRQVQGNDIISRFDYTYNDVGHVTQMQATYGWRNPRSVTSDYSYDPLRRLTRDADSQGIWTNYTFDAVGNRLTLTTNDDSESPRPFDAKTLTYNYNKINQIQTIIGDTHPGQGSVKRSDNVAQALHAFRHEVSAQRGKHINEATADDLLMKVDGLIADLYGNKPPRQNAISDALTSLRDAVNQARSNGTIDSDGIANSLLVKLDNADGANNGSSGDLQTTTFDYDANGNRINKHFPGPQGPQVEGTDYRYDRENRLIEALDYQGNNQGNRVDRAVTRPDYDGIGRRLIKEYDPKTGNGGAKRIEYVFDNLDPIAEYDMWNPQRENFYRGDMNRIIEMQHFPSGTAGQMFWYHYDALGSVTGLTKQQGQSTHNYRYEPYGQIEMPPGNFSDPHNHYTFTGQELDENTGLYDFFARNYDFSTGTWIQQDIYRGEIRDPRTLHRLGYVTNNPTSYVDAYGFEAVFVHGINDDGSGWKNTQWWNEYNARHNYSQKDLNYCSDNPEKGSSCVFKYPGLSAHVPSDEAADSLYEQIKDKVDIVLVAHSKGGNVVENLIARHPDIRSKIKGIVFIEAATGDLQGILGDTILSNLAVKGKKRPWRWSKQGLGLKKAEINPNDLCDVPIYDIRHKSDQVACPRGNCTWVNGAYRRELDKNYYDGEDSHGKKSILAPDAYDYLKIPNPIFRLNPSDPGYKNPFANYG